jgi:hypothetical protein
VLTAVGVIAATLYVRAVDPNVPGHYPGCPTQLLLGIDCPGCGGLRAVHALANGDIAAAADHNILALVALPVVIVLWVMWVRRAWRDPAPAPTEHVAIADASTADTLPRRPWWQRAAMPTLFAVLVAYTVARNVLPYLGSGIG